MGKNKLVLNIIKSNIPIIIAITDRKTGSFTRCVSLFLTAMIIAIMPSITGIKLYIPRNQPESTAKADIISAALLNFLSIIINPFPKVHTLYRCFRHNTLQIYILFHLC